MNATRRTVIGWILAAVIMPPRCELVIDPTGNPVEVAFEIMKFCFGDLNDFEYDWTEAWESAARYMESEVMTSIEIGVTD